ncbi:HNH endonuclease [Corynebacterium sp. NPDC060344]|uniref:HNH endonuclease n=1 Tax=Corynebacterium sp. NPDC060344 TaxID=3347101 RepID=UPI00365071F1
MSIIRIRGNRDELRIAEACAPPDGTADVTDHFAHVALLLGVTPGVAESYADVGVMLRRFPRLARVLLHRGHLPFSHLRVLARCTLTAPDEIVDKLEEALLPLVLPTRDGQALKGWRALHNRVQEVIERFEPLARPRDVDGDPVDDPAEPLKEFIEVEEYPRVAVLNAQLDPARAFEVMTVLDAIAAKEGCSRAEALTHLVRGTCEVAVTLNVYKSWETGETWVPSAGGWVQGRFADDWLDLADGARLCGDSGTGGYAPSEAQKAFIVGRDGTCRFPGCDHPAHRTEGDHVENYDHDHPGAGGATDTENLHCLCKKHHDLKTRKMWDVLRMPDGTEYWTSRTTGMTAVSVPTGPLAGKHRTNFTARQMRKRRTLAEHNEKRLRILEEERRIAAEAREAQRIRDEEEKERWDEVWAA